MCVYMPAVSTGLHRQLRPRGEAQLFVQGRLQRACARYEPLIPMLVLELKPIR